MNQLGSYQCIVLAQRAQLGSKKYFDLRHENEGPEGQEHNCSHSDIGAPEECVLQKLRSFPFCMEREGG
jgi:hypothetical protein